MVINILPFLKPHLIFLKYIGFLWQKLSALTYHWSTSLILLKIRHPSFSLCVFPPFTLPPNFLHCLPSSLPKSKKSSQVLLQVFHTARSEIRSTSLASSLCLVLQVCFLQINLHWHLIGSFLSLLPSVCFVFQ